MYMCKIYWDREQYGEVEALLRQSSEFCSDHPTWKLNVGHTFYIQDKKYREAIKYYEPFVSQTIGDTPSSSSSHQELDLLYPSSSTSILDISAIVLANLCVSYIMTSNNEKAEELMRRIEREEERVGGLSSADGSFLSSDAQPPSPKNTYHLCIVNLVIGTLYCSKGNYEFGISRIIKSMEPYNKKLNTDTWYYAKSCLLSLAENLAKHIFVVNDILFSDIVLFLEDIEAEGQDIKCHYLETEGKEEEEEKEEGKRPKKTTKKKKKGRKFKLISQEARELKRIYLKLRD
jgi:tetratricopeptide repeat protein 30